MIPDRVVGGLLPIAGLEWGVDSRRTHRPNTSWGLSALESYLATVFDGGGAKYIPSRNRRVDLPSSLTHDEVVPHVSQIE